jgi:hypothetical protein
MLSKGQNAQTPQQQTTGRTQGAQSHSNSTVANLTSVEEDKKSAEKTQKQED